MKRALIAAAIAFVVLIFLGGYLAYTKMRPIFDEISKASEVPANLKVARVILGAGNFSSTNYLSDSDLGVITDFETFSNNQVLIAGTNGALTTVWLGSDHTPERKISYGNCSSTVTIIAMGGQDTFLCRSSQDGPTVYDDEGKTIWSYPRDSLGITADDSAAGDVGPAHAESVIVGLNGDGGVRRLTPEGKLVWRKPDGNVWHVVIAPTPNNAGNIIVHSNAAGQLTERDVNGEIIFRTSPEIYLAWFSMTDWGDDPLHDKIVAAGQDGLYIIALDGHTVAKLPSPEITTGTAQAVGVSVHFSPGAASYASIIRNPLWKRTLLYIYDAQNQIIYDQILAQDCGAMRAIANTRGSEDLLVGCDGAVIRYALSK